jgi:hypothetical protein
MRVQAAIGQVVMTAIGRSERHDEVSGRSGGPAGNANLTAWLGLVLLLAFLAELVTLLDVRSLISWHVAIGVCLVPPALMKTATTGWRIVRYYTGSRTYRVAGPPPILLRLLGPLVVITTLGLLATGLVLVFLSPQSAVRNAVLIGPFGISVLLLHKAFFVVWAVATGLHTLARLVPALRLTVLTVARPDPSPRASGRRRRLLAMAGVVVVSTILAVAALPLAKPWSHQGPHGQANGHHVRHH